MSEDRIEIKGRLIVGLLIGGVAFLLIGIAMYWFYFEHDGNPPLLVMGIVILAVGLLFIYLVIAAYLSCFIVDGTGIVNTSLFRGFNQIKWEDIESVVEKPGLEPGIFKLEIHSLKSKRMDVYSNWVKDYDLLFTLVDGRVAVDTSRTRIQESTDSAETTAKSVAADSEYSVGASDRTTRRNLRLRVTGGQLLYLLAMLVMTFFLLWRVIKHQVLHKTISKQPLVRQ